MVESRQEKAPEVPAEQAKPEAVVAAEEERKEGEEERKVYEVAPDEDISQVFVNLDAGVPSDVIESVCMDCKKNGETRFMYTKIPMFKEIILSSFACDHCGYRDNEVQFGGKLGDKGCKYSLNVTDQDCLNRSVVKSEFATIRIPELDFEIPPQTQKGSIKTVEGYLLTTIEGLSELQDQRRKFNPEAAAKIDEFIEKMKAMREGREFGWKFELDDPSGNSFIQNPNAPNPDLACSHSFFQRTVEDYKNMGYNVDEAAMFVDDDKKQQAEIEAAESNSKVAKSQNTVKQTAQEQEALLNKVMSIGDKDKLKAFANRDGAGTDDPEIVASNMDFSKPIDSQANIDNQAGDAKKEVNKFPSECPACFSPGEMKMCIATIPFFKEIIIMAYSCDVCGHRSSEIKQGGGISEKAHKITFHVEKPEDINRDIFKSDTCMLTIPEIDLELQPGTLGSVYTTIEGMIVKVIESFEEHNPFGRGDSATDQKFVEFIAKMRRLTTGEEKFTLIMDDPLSNCFIYNPNAPADDPLIEVEVYERSEEQNQELGISDMRV